MTPHVGAGAIAGLRQMVASHKTAIRQLKQKAMAEDRVTGAARIEWNLAKMRILAGETPWLSPSIRDLENELEYVTCMRDIDNLSELFLWLRSATT